MLVDPDAPQGIPAVMTITSPVSPQLLLLGRLHGDFHHFFPAAQRGHVQGMNAANDGHVAAGFFHVGQAENRTPRTQARHAAGR